MPSEAYQTDLALLAAVIARSAIIVPAPVLRRRLPAGFDDIDAEVLDWIVAEGRRIGRTLALM